jgi:glycosyltransferase involved in cell wall biosynthesis
MLIGMHVGQLLQPVPGGIGTYIRELLTHLPDSKCTVMAFAAGSQPAGLRTPYTDLGWPRGALRYEAWHRLHRPRLPIAVDVIHAPSLAVPPNRLHNHASAALVVTVHDVAFLRYPEYFTPRGVRFHERGLARTRADAAMVITPSEFTRAELGREGFDLDRVVAIPHGIATPAAPDPAAIHSVVSALGLTAPFALAVGTVEPRKGLDTAVAAIARARKHHPALTLVIAGPEGWNTVPDLEQPFVRRIGPVPTEVLDALYRAATLCVVPSRYEGFGLPALEAMARGCPVVVSDTTSLPEVVGDAGLRVPPDDVDAWADAICSLLQDPAHRTAAAAAGIARASGFDWSRAAHAHADVFRHAANGPTRPLS